MISRRNNTKSPVTINIFNPSTGATTTLTTHNYSSSFVWVPPLDLLDGKHDLQLLVCLQILPNKFVNATDYPQSKVKVLWSRRAIITGVLFGMPAARVQVVLCKQLTIKSHLDLN